MDQRPAKQPAWKVTLFFIPGTVLSCAAIFYHQLLAARWRIERFREETPRRVAVWSALDHTRPPVFDDPLPGDAWEIYRRILPDLESLPECRAYNGPQSGWPPVDKFLAAAKPALADLEAALRMNANPPGRDDLLLRRGFSVRDALHRAVYSLISSTRDREGIDLLILSMGMEQDLMRIGTWGSSFAPDSVWPFQEALASHSLGENNLHLLATRLDGIIRTRPQLPDRLKGWAARGRSDFFDKTMKADSARFYPGWRVLWSSTIARSRAMEEYDRLYEYYIDTGNTMEIYGLTARSPRADFTSIAMGHFFCCGAGNLYPEEQKRLSRLASLRLVVALAWYESDRGTFPATLGDLVPKYIESVPDPLPNGSRIEYVLTGRIWTPGDPLNDWSIHRR